MISIADRAVCSDRKASLFLCILAGLTASVLLAAAANAAVDEAWGTVTNVVDGDTFDVTVEKPSDKVAYQVERVRLADVDSPEMDTEEGVAARDFTYAVLMNKKVFLDIDDGSASGRDSYGRLICVAYMSGVYGQPIASPCYNRLLVDSGYASLHNFTNNEFIPKNWWRQGQPADLRLPWDSDEVDQNNSPENQSQDLGRRLKETLEKELLPRLQDSAEKELDRMQKEGWSWLKGQIGLNSTASTKQP